MRWSRLTGGSLTKLPSLWVHSQRACYEHACAFGFYGGAVMSAGGAISQITAPATKPARKIQHITQAATPVCRIAVGSFWIIWDH
jgi:hypothetical protein